MKSKGKSLLFIIIFLNIAFKEISAFCIQGKHILETYGVNDLAEIPDFKGGYINFGYWKDINLKQQITSVQRAKASKNLYKLIFDILGIQKNDTVLEIGCGRGNGCVQLLKKVVPKKIWGIDVTPQQIQRAKSIHSSTLKECSNLLFKIGSSENSGFPANSFDKIYSVEAAQCFSSMDEFAVEAHRILKKGGSLVITAHFSTNEKSYEKVRKFIPTFEKGDRLIPVDQVRKSLKNAGFEEVKLVSIGNYVFKGLDKWLKQIGSIEWVHNFYQCYKEGYLDYYVFVFKKN